MLDKISIRETILKLRDGKSEAWRVSASTSIASRVNEVHAISGGGLVAGYWPFGSEADPRPLMQALEKLGISLCLPVIRKRQLYYRRFAFGDELVPAGWGTFGPGPEAKEVRPAVLLVPLAAVDGQGNRIGWGKGHYDRSIASLLSDGEPLLTIGIAFEFQIVDRVPVETHDKPLDFLATENQIVARRK